MRAHRSRGGEWPALARCPSPIAGAEHTQATSGPTEARQAKEHAPHAHLDASPVPSRLPGAPGPRPVACCYRRRRRIASRPPPRVSICSPQTTRTHTHAGINHTHAPGTTPSRPPLPCVPEREKSTPPPLSASPPLKHPPRRWISASPTRPPARPRVGRGMGFLGRRPWLLFLALALASAAVAVAVEASEGDADPLYRYEILPPSFRCLPLHAAWSRSPAPAPTGGCCCLASSSRLVCLWWGHYEYSPVHAFPFSPFLLSNLPPAGVTRGAALVEI